MAGRYRSRGTYRRSPYYVRRRSAGHEAALRHIEEAEELSEELGGTDEDVKEYFFSLSPATLRPILDDYGRKYGRVARVYAEKTLPSWRSGRTKMSGLVAGRLYNLLPPRMPLDTKYRLIQNLWEKHGPGSHKVLRVGPDANPTEVVSAVRSHIMSVVEHYTIRSAMERRFNWLSMDDAKAKQQLLNHFLELDKRQSVEGVRRQVSVMLEHLKEHGDITHGLTNTIQIGNHRFELRYDTSANGVRLEDPRPISSSRLPARKSHGMRYWVWWVIAAAVLLWMFAS